MASFSLFPKLFRRRPGKNTLSNLRAKIPCPMCKLGETKIVATEHDGITTKITRRCPSCGATIHTYIVADKFAPVGNMPPPKPPTMPDASGPLRDEQGRLLDEQS